MPTLTLIDIDLAGQTGLTVEIFDTSGIANGAGGDALTEDVGIPGKFTATVAESLTGWKQYWLKQSGGYIASGEVYCVGSSWLADDPTVLETSIEAKTTNLPVSPASTTNITAGTLTTVTNLTNAPTSGDLTATMKASVTAAVPTAAQNAAAVDVALINTGDGADLLQAIANQIAADWVAGDASPLAVVSALTSNATFIALVADAAATRSKTDALPSNTAAVLTTIQGYVDTLETEMAKVVKKNENRTYTNTVSGAAEIVVIT